MKNVYIYTVYSNGIAMAFSFFIDSIVANSIAHSKLDHGNSLYYIVQSQINSLVFNKSRNIGRLCCYQCSKIHSHHVTAILKSLHMLKITEKIEYKILSSSSNFSIPLSLHDLLPLQPPRNNSILISSLSLPYGTMQLLLTNY